MTSLTALWLPILLSAVIVFVASSVIHMLTPLHKGDFRRVPEEDRVMAALRPFALPPGDYSMPRATSMKDMGTPEFQAKLKAGPVVMMTVRPSGPTAMGGAFVGWFLFSIVVGVFAGYVASRALAPGAHYLQVFRFVGTVAFVAYSFAAWPLSIWYGRSWGSSVRTTIDGLVYGLLTAGVFGWLWPR
jgi:hypothetical protein